MFHGTEIIFFLISNKIVASLLLFPVCRNGAAPGGFLYLTPIPLKCATARMFVKHQLQIETNHSGKHMTTKAQRAKGKETSLSDLDEREGYAVL